MPIHIDILENKVLGREFKRGEVTVLRRQIEKTLRDAAGLGGGAPGDCLDLTARSVDSAHSGRANLEDLLR